MDKSSAQRSSLRKELEIALMNAIGKQPSLAGYIKPWCNCQTCEVNRAIKRVFDRRRKK